MRRVAREEGAVAVFIAITIVVLVGMGAIVLDVGQLYAERRQLQNGADAAALAIGEGCATGTITCTLSVVDGTADQLANDNSNDGVSDATITEFNMDGPITVETSTRSPDGSDTIDFVLASVLGFTQQTVTARATIAWGAIGGAYTLPLSFSTCEWDALTGGDPNNLPTASTTIVFHTGSPNNCNGPAGQDIPGGFGWLDTDLSGDCQANVESSQWVEIDTGSGSPTPANTTGCTDAFFESLIGEVVLMPIFSEVCQNGTTYPDCPPELDANKKHFFIEGFGAFVVEGFRFGGSVASSPAPCNNPDRCIRGHFVEYFGYGDQPGGSTDFGATTVSLTG